MNLNNQIEALDQELCKVLQGEGNAVAIKNLDSVYSDLEPSLNVWVQSYKRRQLFSTLPDDFAIQGLSEQELENANASLTAMQAFLDTWQELEKKHEISQNDICSDTRDSLYKLSAEIEAANSRQYKAWLTQISDLIEVSESDLIEQEASPNLKENAFQFRKKLDLFRAES